MILFNDNIELIIGMVDVIYRARKWILCLFNVNVGD